LFVLPHPDLAGCEGDDVRLHRDDIRAGEDADVLLVMEDICELGVHCRIAWVLMISVHILTDNLAGVVRPT
jgi:hypothetical protein